MSFITTLDTFQKNGGTLSPEDQIILSSPDKITAIEQDSSYTLFAPIHPNLLSTPEAPDDMSSLIVASSTAIHSRIKTNHLVLFTSDKRAEAEQFVIDNPEHDLIHTTPAGYWLERLKLFNERSFGQVGTEVAYGFWNLAAARLVAQTQSDTITLFANMDNTTSTLWMLELVGLLGREDYNPTITLYANGANKDPIHTQKDAIKDLANPALIEWFNLLQEHDYKTDDETVRLHQLFEKYVKDNSSLQPQDIVGLRHTLTQETLAVLDL